jgi:hypothetical protein
MGVSFELLAAFNQAHVYVKHTRNQQLYPVYLTVWKFVLFENNKCVLNLHTVTCVYK